MPFFIRVLIVILLIIFIEFYFVRRFINSLYILFPEISKGKVKLIKKISLIYLNLYPILGIALWIYILIFKINDYIPPQNIFFDYLILYPFWIGTIVLVQSTLFFLLVDIVRLLLFPLYKKYKEKIKPIEAKIFFGIVVSFLFYVPARVICDLNTVSVNNIEFSKFSLPESLEGFKIALISDIQADRYTNETRLNRFVSTVNNVNPDLVLIAGDVITNTPIYIDLGAEYLGKISAKYGVYSCVGDHDNWAYRFDNERSLNEITSALRRNNVPMIDNDSRIIEIDSATIGITFITNTYVEKIDEGKLDSLTNGNLSTDLKIFLTHQPRENLINKAKEQNYDLYLAGHTHGGQLTFIFPFLTLTPTLVETNLLKGAFIFDDLMVVVTGGLGMSLAPVRYNSTPEVTVITLKKKRGVS